MNKILLLALALSSSLAFAAASRAYWRTRRPSGTPSRPTGPRAVDDLLAKIRR
jgi:hypothetical protein